jgi:hypothetical protein
MRCSEPQAAKRLKKGLILFHRSMRWRQRRRDAHVNFGGLFQNRTIGPRAALSKFRARPNRKRQALFDNQSRKPPYVAACLECSRGERLTLKALPDVSEFRPPYQRRKEKQNAKSGDRSRSNPIQYEPIRSRANHDGFPCRDAKHDGA